MDTPLRADYIPKRPAAPAAGKRPIPGRTDLAATHPALAAQWSDKNALRPEDVSRGSARRVWWVCGRGHEYEAPVYARVAGTGCPYCAGKLAAPGETDLATTHPALAAEWDREKNALRPTEVTAGSHRMIWWRCPLGHSYAAAPYTRVSGSGCPYCTNRRVLAGFNDLLTTHPALCREWDEARNAPLTPKDVTFGSNRRVWWRCATGHVWQAAVFSRTRQRPAGCPVCNGKYRPRRYEMRNVK